MTPRHVLFVLGLSACAHGAAFRAPPRAGSLSVEERALIARMSTDAPTAHAMAARRQADQIRGELGSAEPEQVVNSSIRWIEHLERSGATDRLRAGRCTRAASKGGDVIASLATERAPAPREPAPVALAFWAPGRERPDCVDDLGPYEALAITRAWLATRSAAAVRAIDAVIARVTEAPPLDCSPTERDRALGAAMAHHFALYPLPTPSPVSRSECVPFVGLAGTSAPTLHPVTFEAAVTDEGEASAEALSGAGLVTDVLVRVEGEWAVIDACEGIVCVVTYLRGEL